LEIDTWKSVCLFTLMTVCWTTFPALAGNDKEILVDIALKLSGVSEQMESMHLAVFSAVSADTFPDYKSRNQAKSIMQKAAGKDALLPFIRASLLANFNESRIEEVIDFFDSDLGRKVSRLIRRATAPEVVNRVWKNRTTIRKLKEPRSQILQRIMKAEKVTEFGPMLVNEVIRGMADASLERTTGIRPAAGEIRKRLDVVKSQVRSDNEFTEEVAYLAFAHTYRSLSDAQLEALAVYQESAAGRWFGNTVQQGMEKAAYHAGRSLAAALDSVKPKAQKNPSGKLGPQVW
jgi:hypothetical protein